MGFFSQVISESRRSPKSVARESAMSAPVTNSSALDNTSVPNEQNQSSLHQKSDTLAPLQLPASEAESLGTSSGDLMNDDYSAEPAGKNLSASKKISANELNSEISPHLAPTKYTGVRQREGLSSKSLAKVENRNHSSTSSTKSSVSEGVSNRSANVASESNLSGNMGKPVNLGSPGLSEKTGLEKSIKKGLSNAKHPDGLGTYDAEGAERNIEPDVFKGQASKSSHQSVADDANHVKQTSNDHAITKTIANEVVKATASVSQPLPVPPVSSSKIEKAASKSSQVRIGQVNVVVESASLEKTAKADRNKHYQLDSRLFLRGL
ncbi:hypothetical protein [Aurantivibrio plasticivorans]